MERIERYFENEKFVTITEKKHNLVSANGKTFTVQENERGYRKKFWLSKKNHVFHKIYLFKENVTTQSREDIGEMLFYEIAKQAGVPSVESHLARLVKADGTKSFGILSKNYKTSEDITEVSGKSLLQMYNARYYDNEQGKRPVIANNADTYIKALRYLYPEENINYKKLRNDMAQMTLMDFLTRQTDRHWYNLTFLIDNEKGLNSLCLAPLYDNGNIFNLNKDATLYARYMQQIYNNDFQFMESLFSVKNCAPQFSLSVPNAGVLRCSRSDSPITVLAAPTDETVYEKELAKEIVKNPFIQKLYLNIISQVNLQKAFENIYVSRTALPQEAIDYSQMVYDERKERINHAILNELDQQPLENNTKLTALRDAVIEDMGNQKENNQ